MTSSLRDGWRAEIQSMRRNTLSHSVKAGDHVQEKSALIQPGPVSFADFSNRFATQLIQTTLASLIQRFEFEVVDTSWERDVRVARESILTAPAFESKGVKFSLSGYREHDV